MTIRSEEGSLLVVGSDDVVAQVDRALALEAARTAARCRLDPSTEVGRLTLGLPGGWLRLLGASIPSLGVFGYKQFHLAAGDAVRYAVHVFAVDDGRPLGIVDGALLTPFRTAAAAAAAAVAHAGPDPAPRRVAVIGSSTEAEHGLRALAAALPVASATVTSRRATNREAFARRLSDELDREITPAATIEDAVDGADVVYVGTASGGAVVVGPGQLDRVPLVLSIGSTLPVQRELDGSVIADADRVVVDTTDVLVDSGDALAAGAAGWNGEVRTLGEFLDHPGDVSGRTVYKSIGSPEQDVVLAAAVLESARARGFGRTTDPFTDVKRNLT